MPTNSIDLLQKQKYESYDWKTRLNETKINVKHVIPREKVLDHPLQRFSFKLHDDNTKKIENTVLSIASPLDKILDGNDPLSKFQKQVLSTPDLSDDDTDHNEEVLELAHNKTPFTEPWSLKKETIMSEFCNFDVDIDLKRLQVESSDCLALDEELVTQIRKLNPTELINKLGRFRKDIVRTWNDEQRVETLRTVITCCKLLMDTETPVSYPLKFAHVSEVLDAFGYLVYKRLKMKCQQWWKPRAGGPATFPPNFTAANVPDAARETCLNWFSKIASIRELVPRLYAEAALLRSYGFLNDEKIVYELKKLIKLTRGVGNPLVNLYLRCYLCRVAIDCNVLSFNFFQDNFDEFITIFSAFLARQNSSHKPTLHRYLETYLPGLEWLIRGVVDQNEKIQDKLLKAFRSMPNHSIFLLAVLNSFKKEFIFDRMDELINWLREPPLVEVPKYKFLKYLGKLYEKRSQNDITHVPQNVANTIWEESQLLTNTTEYLNIIDLWLPLSVSRLPSERVNSLLDTLGPHIAREHFVDRFSTRLENIVRNLARYMDDFLMFLISEFFLTFLNTIPKGKLRVTVCKIIMEALVQRNDETLICDSVTLNSMMYVAKTLHDSVRMLTVLDERKQIGNLLSKFIRLVKFEDGFERQLDFYVEARSTFYEFDTVLITLIHCTNRLAFEKLKSVKAHHDIKSADFAHSCVAYNYITIPSIKSPISRMQLQIISGQVALANQCLDMASAFFEEAIMAIPKFPNPAIVIETGVKNEEILKSYIRELMSILLVVPDDPDGRNVFPLFTQLYRALKSYRWQDSTAVPSLNIALMHLYSICYQEVYPYHFLNVDSNDTLYGPDEALRRKINVIITNLMHEVFAGMSLMGEVGRIADQGSVAMNLIVCMLTRGDMSDPAMAVLTAQLWYMCHQQQSAQRKFLSSCLRYCIHASPSSSEYETIFKKIQTKFNLER